MPTANSGSRLSGARVCVLVFDEAAPWFFGLIVSSRLAAGNADRGGRKRNRKACERKA